MGRTAVVGRATFSQDAGAGRLLDCAPSCSYLRALASGCPQPATTCRSPTSASRQPAGDRRLLKCFPKIRALWDGDENRPEITVSGTSVEMSSLGALLTTINAPVTLALEPGVSQAYPVCLGRLVIEPDVGERRLAVAVTAGTLRIGGGAKALAALAQSLLNFFEGEIESGSHFHLEYYEGNEMLEPTSCTLVFLAA